MRVFLRIENLKMNIVISTFAITIEVRAMVSVYLLRAQSQVAAGHRWLTPEIPATWEADIRRIMV
jgi:hypothetical protein